MVLKHVPLDVRSRETLPAEKLHEGQRAAQAAASSRGIELVLAAIDNTPTEIEQAIAAFARAPNGGLVLPPDTNTNLHRDLIIRLAARHRLPAVYSDRFFVTADGLMCYSTDRTNQFGTAASYVDRILRGAKINEAAN